MFVSVFVFLALVATGSSQQCCGEKKFQVSVGGSIGQVQSGSPAGIQFYYQTAVDYVGQQIGGEGYVTVVGSTPIEVKYIQLWKEKKQYTIVNKVCTVALLTYPEPTPCIPSDAKFQGYITLGKDEFVIQSWEISPADVGLIDGVVYISVSNKTCVANSVNYIGTMSTEQGPVSSVFSAGYFNYSSGIVDPKKWFDVPSSCPHEVKDTISSSMGSGHLDTVMKMLQRLMF